VLTPATPPVIGSWSYLSQESSHCSTLNNAVIMDEDEVETIPTDEKKKERVVQIQETTFRTIQYTDLSPIDRTDMVPLNDYSGNNSSLQDFLRLPQNQPEETIILPPNNIELLSNISPSGPQWSPGIRGSEPSPSPLSSPKLPSGERTIRIEQTLNFLDASPISDSSEQSIFHNPIDSAVPSPVRRFTHRRSNEVPLVRKPNRLSDTIHDRPGRPVVSFLDQSANNRSQSCTVYGRARQYDTLSTADREYMEAAEGRRRLVAQIERNRANFESIKRRPVGYVEPAVLLPRPHTAFARSIIEPQQRLHTGRVPSSFMQPPSRVISSADRSAFLYPPRRPTTPSFLKPTDQSSIHRTCISRKPIGTATQRSASIERPPWR
jgi:hypothetical protein